MRNLKNIFLEETAAPEGSHLSTIAWDATDNSIVGAFGPAVSSPVIDLKRKRHKSTTPGSEFDSITTWETPCPLPDLPCDEIICFQYFSDTATSCLILAGGDLIVVREDPQHGEERIEIVGSVDGGVAAAAWAPDEELLAIVTRMDTLILMTRQFEPVTDVALTAEDLRASKHVSVGWGKKETQFQGKRARALRDPTMPESTDEGRLSPFEKNRTSVSWRGDGAFLAVNRIVPNGRRLIRIFSREGTVDSASEPVDGLESALSWRPAGNLLAGVQRLDDRLQVIFFEKNGLRHGEFPLRLSKSEMQTWGCEVSLSWNIDSTVLAVSFRDRIQLWMMGNYHYYLKQEILFQRETLSPPHSVSWHPEKPLRIAVPCKSGVLDLEYMFCVNRGSTLRPHDDGVVAVIDGTSLKLTPLKYAMVPPPLCLANLVTDQNIISCSVSWSGNRVVTLTTLGIDVYEWDFKFKPATAPKRLASFSFESDTEHWSNTRSVQVQVQNEERVRLLSHSRRGGSKITSFAIDDSEATLKIIDLDTHVLDSDQGGFARIIFTDNKNQYLWWQTAAGLVCSDRSDLCCSSAVHSATEIMLVEGCRKNSVDDDVVNHSGRPCEHAHIISLSAKGELFANDKLVSRGCTSFVTTDAYLIFTTSQHLLMFVHINASNEYEIPSNTPEADERCRKIERGAKLVTVIPSIYAVVLQMPRGNLETVYPRALVLAGIRQHLVHKDFKEAFLACQNHQVDLNIIYDYRPDLFMVNVSLFVEQIKSISRVDLFLSKLSDEDVSKTLYKDTLVKRGLPDSNATGPTSPSSPLVSGVGSHDSEDGKVNRICNGLLSVLKPRISQHLQNVLTAHVCKRPPDLISALELVASLRKMDGNRAEDAISHLCFLVDVNLLYDTALSLYDLPLTLLVAQQAQRDPREYMPFLQSLNELPHLRRNFTMDDHLRHYSKALVSLHAMGAHNEVEDYTTKHALYQQALKLYWYDAEHVTTITRLHAQYLTSQSNHLASAIASESLADYSLASSSYAKCSPPYWREALHCASMVQPPLGNTEIQSLALQLATTLVEEQRDYRSASQIHTDYLHDALAAVRMLCRGSYFAEGLRLLSLHGLPSQIPDLIDVALAEKSGEIGELIADCRSQLAAQMARIKELRVRKAEDPLAFFGGDPSTLEGDEGDIADNISLAPTDASTMGGQSLFTRYTGNHKSHRFAGTVASHSMSEMSRKTSRTRRREERKRARGKKGSVYEEEYLVGSVKRLVERVNGVHGEVERLVQGLARRGMREREENVQSIMEEITQECERAVKEIWIDVSGEPSASVAGAGAQGEQSGSAWADTRPKGADGVLWESQIEARQGRAQAPAVKNWKGYATGSGKA